jgi:hypothetical protein
MTRLLVYLGVLDDHETRAIGRALRALGLIGLTLAVIVAVPIVLVSVAACVTAFLSNTVPGEGAIWVTFGTAVACGLVPPVARVSLKGLIGAGLQA